METISSLHSTPVYAIMNLSGSPSPWNGKYVILAFTIFAASVCLKDLSSEYYNKNRLLVKKDQRGVLTMTGVSGVLRG